MAESNLTAVCIGTGPSITFPQIEIARQNGWVLCGCNNVYQIVPDLEIFYAVNEKWWDHYWPDISHLSCEKWTTNREAADRYQLNWIAEKNAPGLSKDPSIIHHGHGSGYSLLNVVFLKGFKRIVLLGYDLKYAPDYDGRLKKIGVTPRHYFGEYPLSMQHWPSVRVEKGVHVELLQMYQTVADQGVVEIINCSPDTALKCFPQMRIEDVI